MARRTIGRTKIIEIKDTTNPEQKIQLEIRGLGAATAIDLAQLSQEKNKDKEITRLIVSKGVIRIVSGIENDNGSVAELKDVDLVDILEVDECAELVVTITNHSNITKAEKKT